jgi:hypothetical protein
MLPTRHLLEFLLTVYILILIPVGIRNIRDRKELARLFAPVQPVAPKPIRRIVREGTGAGGGMLIGLGLGLALTTRRS